MLALSLIAALALDSARLHGAGFFRIAIFLPYAVPGVVAALIWGFIYGDQFGLTGIVNDLLGTQSRAVQLPSWILASIGNIVTWEFMGYNMLIFYAALRVVPTELYEAAEIDGAGQFRTIFSIKLPALRGAIVIATIFSIIGSFQLFNEPNLLKTLAPNVISSYFTPNMYAYNLSFAGQQFNYAATVAIVMGVITAVIAYIVQVRGYPTGEPLTWRPSTAVPRRSSGPSALRPAPTARLGTTPVAPRAQVDRPHHRHGASSSSTRSFRCAWLVINATKTQPTSSRRSASGSATGSTCSQNIVDTLTYHDGIFVQWFGNTLLYVVVGAGGATLLATVAGYGLAKFRFPGKRAVFAVVLGAVAIPGTALAVPDLPAVQPARPDEHARGRSSCRRSSARSASTWSGRTRSTRSRPNCSKRPAWTGPASSASSSRSRSGC